MENKGSSTEVANFNSDMFDKGNESAGKVSVMSGIHEVKAYNRNPNDFNGTDFKEEFAGKFKVKVGLTGDEKFIDSFKFNPLSVCKVKSGMVYLLDEFGDPIKDANGNDKNSLFYTQEHSIYTSKTDTLGLKGNGQVVGFYQKQDLDKMLRSRKLELVNESGDSTGKQDNPFYKSGTDLQGRPYHDTFMKDKYVMYGVFIDGDFAGEYFKMYLSPASFGKTFDKEKGKIPPKKGTLQYTNMIDGLEAWNKLRESNGQQPIRNVAYPQLDLVCRTEELTIGEGDNAKIIYTTKFDFDGLTGYRTNNLTDVEFITDLQKQYLEQEFVELGLPQSIQFPEKNLAVLSGSIKYPSDVKGELPEGEDIQEGEVDKEQELLDEANAAFGTTSDKKEEVSKEAKRGKAPF